MCQTQNQTQREEIIEVSGNYKLYREYRDGTLRLVKKYASPQTSAETMIEVDDQNILRIRTHWFLSDGSGVNGFPALEIKLEPRSAEKVRNYMLRVRSLLHYCELEHWLLSAKYVTQPCAVMAIESTKEPSF